MKQKKNVYDNMTASEKAEFQNKVAKKFRQEVTVTSKTIPSPTSEEELYGPDDPAEEAFTKSDVHALNDLELQPYTPDRAWAAQAMGLRYGFVDDAGVEFFREHRIYPGALRDVAVVLWLCSLEDELEIDKASRNPVAAARKAATWAHERKLENPRGDEFWKAYAVFMKIMGEVDASVSVPEPSGNGTANPPNE